MENKIFKYIRGVITPKAERISHIFWTECSNCGGSVGISGNYCKNCGAKFVEEVK